MPWAAASASNVWLCRTSPLKAHAGAALPTITCINTAATIKMRALTERTPYTVASRLCGDFVAPLLNFCTGTCAIIPKVFVELGELLDEAERRPDGRAIDPGDERNVFPPRQIAVKGAAEAERKGNARITADRPAVGQLRAGE